MKKLLVLLLLIAAAAGVGYVLKQRRSAGGGSLSDVATDTFSTVQVTVTETGSDLAEAAQEAIDDAAAG